MTPAILFAPDGYLLTGPKLMGRQAAGNGFLRAAIAGRGSEPVVGYGASVDDANEFRAFVDQVDPAAETLWVMSPRVDLLGQFGVLYRPDQILGPNARHRLRAGPAAYSLCGVTHTLATHTTLDAIAKLAVEPVMPWDALVCTSRVALEVVGAVLGEAEDYHRWATGQAKPREWPLLPVIPLGVHCADFDFGEAERAQARTHLGLAADEVVVLAAGRLSPAGKAHPLAMLRAVQSVAAETGKPVVLTFAGQAYDTPIKAVYEASAATLCPDVRVIFVDGKDAADYRRAWAGADIFISLADSIQETFGLTPVEAMAAGLPALVSDWNGYKDTVRDGVDGFRIPTWAPAPGAGLGLGADYESGVTEYNEYLLRSSTAVALDMGRLTARLGDLVTDADLRRRLGEAGRQRARETFDWSVVYRAYQALWTEQAAIRAKAAADPATRDWLARAPRRGADHLGPFDTFASYPTAHIGPATLVSLATDLSSEAYGELTAQPLLIRYLRPELHDTLRDALRAGPMTVDALAGASGLTLAQTIMAVARLAKIDVLALAGAEETATR